MTKTVMSARVTDQHLTLVNVPLIASGGVDEIRIHFQFCGLWDGCGKTAVFYRDPDEVYHVPIADGSVIVPHEVLTEEGFFYFGVMGTADNIRTTEVVRLYVAQGAITTATANHEELTPDIYQQILAAYGKLDTALARETATREAELVKERVARETEILAEQSARKAEIAVERARLDNFATMKSAGGVATYDIPETDGITGTITSNGIMACIYVEVSGDFTTGDFTQIALPEHLAPLGDFKEAPVGAQFTVKVSGYNSSSPYMLIQHTATTHGSAFAYVHYPLASVTVAEVIDGRVDHNGHTHVALGTAIREQMKAVTEGVSMGNRAIQPRSIEFVERTVNLFDFTDSRNRTDVFIKNGAYVSESGSAYSVTHPIYMEAGEQYKWKHSSSIGSVAQAALVNYETLDIIKAYSTTIELIDDVKYELFTPTTSGYYVVNFNGASQANTTFMVCRSEDYPADYVSYGYEIHAPVPSEYLSGKIAIDKTDFFAMGVNLYDETDERNRDGMHVKKNAIANLSGASVTHPIYMEGGKSYKYPQTSSLFGSTVWVAYVTKNGELLATKSGSYADGYATFTPTASGYYCVNKKTTQGSFMVCLAEEYPEDYVPFEYIPDEKISLNERMKAQCQTNPLYGKKISLNGDSLCATPNGGYGRIIADRNLMIYQNVAQGGGTITAETYGSETGTAKHWICRTIASMDATADYAIIEGGVNDASIGVPLGAITSGYNETLDDTTFYGAFESMLKQLTIRFTGKKIGYIAVHKMTKDFKSENDPATSYYWAAKKCCQKWGVPFLDLNDAVPPFAYFSEDGDADLYALRTTYTQSGDGWHPTAEGYEKYYVPKIEAWLKTL